MRRTALSSLILAALLAGCSAVNTDGLVGNVRREYYVSPTGNFKVHVPPLHEDATVRDYSRPDRSGVLFEDTYCRQYVIWEEPTDLGGLSFEEGIYRPALEALKYDGATIIDSDIVETLHGQAASVRYRQRGTPCVTQSAERHDGSMAQAHQESEILEYILYKDGIKYALSYVLGDPRNIHQDASLNKKLDPFLAGFEITREPEETAPAPAE
ncbi:hypothetical protein LPW11_18405 [Geomonas sp. RF6]|uniref:hypothetical protein n=1 Tax=Geomonas sp. RF6 TaxID=2897342 RepID=UPI001E63998B|nr:hypothetical protein [Geomonas sp. RF6]UFS69848.1 hypothetical protein LPW11_18405 [Geomonas sp. RF6]